MDESAMSDCGLMEFQTSKEVLHGGRDEDV